ncbi:MAG: hypothetical protein H6773_03750 [Pseudomonadales bacterium]|nr:hypothetical protein [Candidatus Woesebacteria bacterium]MCB9801271.1 hypothetical protein [Pseudomonadales bacterium]
MLLTEYEGKQLLATAGLQIPKGQLVSFDVLEEISFPDKCMIKAQVLHGNRALNGLVKKAESRAEAKSLVAEMATKTDRYGEPFTDLLIEEVTTFSSQWYVALRYDTKRRRLVCDVSAEGGMGMDDRGGSIQTIELSVLTAPVSFDTFPSLLPVIQKMWQVFILNDAVLVEINPLVETAEGFVCLDAKIELEDAARFRHPEWKTISRAAGEKKRSKLEKKALAISRSDYQGVAGESFFEFPGGTIGVLASGGGASALVMDGLLQSGLRPANYTEYSGNPKKEKVAELTKLVASLDNLEGMLVVGSTANFTDIYETLSGVVEGLLASPLGNQTPVVIRRGGPRWQEAFEMVQERLPKERFDVHLLGPDVPILDSVIVLRDVLQKKQNNKGRW